MVADYGRYVGYLNSRQNELVFGVPEKYSRLNSFELLNVWGYGGNSDEEIKRRLEIIDKVTKKELERIDNETKLLRFPGQHNTVKREKDGVIGKIDWLISGGIGELNSFSIFDSYEYLGISEFEIYAEFKDFLNSYNGPLQGISLSSLEEYYVKILRESYSKNFTELQKQLLKSILNLLYCKFKLKYLRDREYERVSGKKSNNTGPNHFGLLL